MIQAVGVQLPDGDPYERVVEVIRQTSSIFCQVLFIRLRLIQFYVLRCDEKETHRDRCHLRIYKQKGKRVWILSYEVFVFDTDRVGVSTPINDTLTSLIHSKEKLYS